MLNAYLERENNWMEKKRKLLVFDLDGTLLTDTKNITLRTRETLKRAKEKGYALCFASGRCEEMMSIYQDAVGGCDYCISCNGAKTMDLLHDRVIASHTFRPEDVISVLEYVMARNMDFMMYGVNKMYFPSYSKKMEEHVMKYERLSVEWGFPAQLNAVKIKQENLSLVYKGILKIVVYLRDEIEKREYTAFVEYQDNLIGESTGYGLLGTFEKKVSKKTALEALMQYMQITRKDVYVFGDYDNDLSMFSVAANRIAVMNALDVLKEKATFITASNNEDGVAVYLENVLNI